jgi:predicted 3-demethylubiquinone-9 3-methyltransferase (glyoxalase superfamily)
MGGMQRCCDPMSRSTDRRYTVPKITPFLWFDGNAEEAARFYTSIFPNSLIDKVVPAAADTPGNRKGEVITVEFTLDGTRFVGLNGGPEFRFSEAVSFEIECQDQAEVDRYWDALVQGGGEHSVCGWLKDKFGLSWQVVPRRLNQMVESGDRAAAERAMKAMLDMTKLDVAKLEEAYKGEPALSR